MVGNCQKTEDCEDSPVKGYRKSFFGSDQVTVCDNCSKKATMFLKISQKPLNISKNIWKFVSRPSTTETRNGSGGEKLAWIHSMPGIQMAGR